MEVHSYIPHLALQDYVWNISTVNVELPKGVTDVVSPYPPTPFQSLIFYCNDPISAGRFDIGNFELQPDIVLIGPQFSRVNIKVHQRLRAVRVDFLPGGMYRLLGIPMHQLFDNGYNALDFFGSELRSLNAQIQNTLSLEEAKTIVEHFLLKQVTGLKEVLPFDKAMYLLFNQHGAMSITETAALSCLSMKQFERKCKERIGMNPKTYARILKFSKAYRLHEAYPHMSWTHIAHEAGYYDQMHMIKDFKVFAGVNPSIIEQQLSATPLRMQKDIGL